ncbi:MAG: hypothetical protein CME63_11630 [Halobacteriovoraceae bacterium]|nr:hypothetical protein [Halobacteriovoraceae bacterium]
MNPFAPFFTKLKMKFSSGHWPVFVAGIISSFINLFLPTLLVRMLTPEDIGIYKIYFLYIHSFTFLSLAGAPLYSVFYYIGKKEGKEYIDHAWKMATLLSLVALAIGILFSSTISERINLTQQQTLLLLFSGALIPPSSFYGEYLVAKGKTLSGPLFHSAFEVFKGVGIILAAYLTRDINTTFIVFGITFLIKFLLSLILGLKDRLITLKIDIHKMKEIFIYCAPMSSAGLLGFFLEKIDMLTLSSYLSPTDFAFYSMGCLVVPPLFILEMSVTKVLMPKLSKLWHESKLREMGLSLKKAQEDIAFLMIPAVCGLIIYSRPIIELLFTDQYLESIPYLRIFALSYLTYIIPHDTIARATGKTKWILKVYLVITPLSLIAVTYSAKFHGALSALTLTVIFRFIPKFWGLYYSSQKTGLSILELLPLRSWGLNLLTNMILLILVLTLKPLFKTELIWFFSTAPLYLIGFFSIHLLFKIKRRQNLHHKDNVKNGENI